jgi:hypothetical protein
MDKDNSMNDIDINEEKGSSGNDDDGSSSLNDVSNNAQKGSSSNDDDDGLSTELNNMNTDSSNSNNNNNKKKKNTCLCCLKEVEGSSRCSQCRTALYCSKDCQVKHWPAHKNSCVRNKEDSIEKLELKAHNHFQQGNRLFISLSNAYHNTRL